MAIIKRGKSSFQTKLRGSDGRWITKTFQNKMEAMHFEAKLKTEKFSGGVLTSFARSLSLDEFFERWFLDSTTGATIAWRRNQRSLFFNFVSPLIGQCTLSEITPITIARVLSGSELLERKEGTQKHVYILLRRLFRDAIELYQYLTHNPVQRKLRPSVPIRETPHLNLEEVKKLLVLTRNRPYGTAIWTQLYLGLRVGELQALRWTDFDLDNGIARIHRSFQNNMVCFKDYPKGRKQHSHRIPSDLLALLKERESNRVSEFVATGPRGQMVQYSRYRKKLREYCQELGITVISTHGLRHSTSELYMSHGATCDDMRLLFAHSCQSVTDRYLHNRGTNLEKVTKTICLFPVVPNGELPLEAN